MKVFISANWIFFAVQMSTAIVLGQSPDRFFLKSTDQGLEKFEWCWPWQFKHWTCPSMSSTTPQTTSAEPFTTPDYPESTTDANTSESSINQTTTLQTDTSTENTRASTFSHLESTTIYSSESTTGTVSTTAEYFSSFTFDSTTDESDPSSEPSTTTELPDVDGSLVLRVVIAITIVVIAAVCVFAFYKIINRTNYRRIPSNSDSATV